MSKLLVSGCITVLLGLSSSAGANQVPKSDPKALAYAAQSLAALTGGASINDATLTGNVKWTSAAHHDTGTATLSAKGTSESRLDLVLSRGNRSEIRNDTAGFPQGESIAPDGARTPWELHNCWINASWFFPGLSFLAAQSDQALIFSYIGKEMRGGKPVQHLQIYRYLPNQKPKPAALIQALSTTDIYLDTTSLLPTAMTFNTHPDDDAGRNISIEVSFLNYQSVNGVQVPMHVKKKFYGSPALDITVTSVSFNTGLPDSMFTIQ